LSFFRRISRAITRADDALGSAEGTTVETGGAFNPRLGHIEAAERQEFPPEEFAADEDDESE